MSCAGRWKMVWSWFLVLAGFGLAAPLQARADQVFVDDIIIQSSLCVGLNCVNNESFGFDTIRMKEDNTRIKFDDTSVSPGYPANDWQLTANDSNNGGLNKFSIDDITGAKTPFTVEAAAPTNSVYIDSTGRVGLGTDTPVLDLHLRTSNTPATRLEQSTAGGFTAQTWDVAGNEANFFVRDVTSGSQLPFRIRPGARTSSLDISASGNIGLGVPNPAGLIDGSKPSEVGIAETIARFVISDDAVGQLLLNNGSTTDAIYHPRLQGTTALQATALTLEGLITNDFGANPVVSFNAARIGNAAITTRPLVVFRNNLVIKASIAANGDVFATSFNPTSSRTMKDDIVDLDSETAAIALGQLTPVEYVYKDDTSKEKRVGFIAEDVPDIVANADRKSVPIMDVVALVTRVVKDQQQTIDEQKKTIDALTKRLDALESQMQRGD